MATIATGVLWGSGPNTYFDFSYEKKREGSTQYYSITVSCRPITGNSFFGYPINVAISLDGVSKTSYTLKGASPDRWASAISNTTGWLAVSNKTSGTTAIAIRIYSSNGSPRDATYTYTLAIDPAASTITCTTANIESRPTISISRASSSFTHTITYSFGTLTGTIAEKTSATTITSWAIPASFYKQIPNAKKGEGILTCTTYSGNTPVGTSSCKLSVTTDETKCKPTVSGTVVDINPVTTALTGNNKILIRYCSTALCTINATLNKDAGSFLAKTINNVAVTGDTLTIPNVEAGVFDFYAKDSREYFNSDKKLPQNLIEYTKLTCNATAQRTDPTSGNATLKIEGNYYDGIFGAEDNSLTVKYRQGTGDYVTVTPKIAEDKYTATVSLTGLDYTKSFNYEVVVEDKINTITKSLTIQKGFPVFDWGEDDFNFNVPVKIDGTLTIGGTSITEAQLASLLALIK